MKKEAAEDFIARMVQDHPEWANMTLDDFRAEMCRLQASIEDAERRRTALYRQRGLVSPYDARLFLRILKAFPPNTTTEFALAALRARKRRGHVQQEALDVYDRHYAAGGRFPTGKEVDTVEALFERLEARR